MDLSWLEILLLSVLNGLTGIFPMSDSGFLTAARNLLGLPLSGEADGFLQGLCLLGVAASICIVYRFELIRCFAQSGRRDEYGRLGQRQFMLVVCSFLFSIPGLVFGSGIPFAGKLIAVTFMLILDGFVIFAGDRMNRGENQLSEATLGDGIAIGLAQSISVLPGLSRTGLSMTFGIFRGLDPGYCLEFSMLSAIPFIFVRALILIFSSAKPEGGILLCMAGMFLSGIISYFALRILRFSVKRGSTGYFAFIAWGMALLMFMLYLIS